MIYSFLEVIHNVLRQAFAHKAVIGLGVRPAAAGNTPQLYMHLGKLIWGKTHLDVPTFHKDRCWTIRPFEQVVYMDISAKTYADLEATSAFLTTVLLTNMDEMLKMAQKSETEVLQETYQWICMVKMVQWSHQKILTDAPFAARIKLKVLGDFKAIKMVNMGTDIIKKVHIIEK